MTLQATSLHWFCRNCSHMTIPDGPPLICCWCHSPNIGINPELCGPTRAMGSITEPEDRQPTKHQRLKEGFALLRDDYGSAK